MATVLAGFIVDKSGTGTGLFPSTSIFPCQYHSAMSHTDLHLNVLLSEGQADEAWEPSKKQCSFGHQ